MAEASGQASDSMSFSMRTTVYGIKKKFPSVKNVSCQDLEQWRKENQKLICLDTRPEEEYRVSHLPGSIRVDPDAEPDLKTLGISVDSTVVCYCSVGYRSSNVAQKLLRAHKHSGGEGKGAEPLRIYNLEGGVFQWACEGRGLTNEAGEKVPVVHPYSTFWGMLLPNNLRHKINVKSNH